MAQSSHTSVTVREETRDRLKDTKPYQSMSYDELVRELLEVYESKGEK